jgi:hypothetical protein
MAYIYDKQDLSIYAVTPIAPGGDEIGFFDGMEKFFEVQAYAKNTDAYNELLSEKMEPIIQRLEDAGVEGLINPGNFGGMASDPSTNTDNRKIYLDRLLKGIKDNPSLFPEPQYQNINPENIDADIKNEARALIERGKGMEERLTGMGQVGAFIGEVGGFLVDDNFFYLNLITGRPIGMAAMSLARRVLYEGIAAAGAEGLLQTGVKEWYDQLGIKYGVEDFIYNVAGAATFGAGLPVALRGVGAGLKFTTQQMRNGLDALSGAGHISRPDAAHAKAILDDEEIIREAINASDLPPHEAVAALDQATAELAANKIKDVSGLTPEQSVAPTVRSTQVEAPTSLDRQIDDIADDDIIFIDNEVNGAPIEISGAVIKDAIRQDNAMLDRLRGCVLR